MTAEHLGVDVHGESSEDPVDKSDRPDPDDATPDGALASLIAREMRRQGLTLDALARRSGLAIATIAALRAGTRGKRPRAATLQRLALGLGLPEQQVATAAQVAQPLSQTEREASLLSVFRQLQPSEQLLAERIVRQIARTPTLPDDEDAVSEGDD